MKCPCPAGIPSPRALTATGWELGNGLECIPRQQSGGRSCFCVLQMRKKLGHKVTPPSLLLLLECGLETRS